MAVAELGAWPITVDRSAMDKMTNRHHGTSQLATRHVAEEGLARSLTVVYAECPMMEE
jgi:hypothetical protein